MDIFLYKLVEEKLDEEIVMDVYLSMKTFIHENRIPIGNYIRAMGKGSTNQKDEENINKVFKDLEDLLNQKGEILLIKKLLKEK